VEGDSGLTIECKVKFTTLRRGRKRMTREEGKARPPAAEGSVPRLSRLMALAIRFEKLVQKGHVASYADLARLGYVTRARMTQITNLLLLAPDIQEDILFLPRTTTSRDPICERHVRAITAVPDWRKQRRLWHLVK